MNSAVEMVAWKVVVKVVLMVGHWGSWVAQLALYSVARWALVRAGVTVGSLGAQLVVSMVGQRAFGTVVSMVLKRADSTAELLADEKAVLRDTLSADVMAGLSAALMADSKVVATDDE